MNIQMIRTTKPRNLFKFLLLTALWSALPAFAGMPPVPEIPVSLPESVRQPLIEKRQPLALKKMKLIDEGTELNRHCASVVAGSEQYKACLARQKEFNAKVAALQAEFDQFEDEIEDAVSHNARTVKTLPAFSFPSVESRGEFYLVTADGRRLSGKDAANVPVDKRVTAITGPDGWARLTLPDGTLFTIGANSNMVLDEFVYDPKPGIGKMTANLIKGSCRFITGQIKQHRAYQDTLKVKLPVGDLGPRGTDFECSVSANGSGFVKLYSGEVALTAKVTGAVIVLKAGQMITFTSSKINNPVQIPGEV